MEKKSFFNLLKPVAPPKNLWDKAYEWVVGRARVVLLLTELVIAVAFVSKVVVDTQAKNKTKAIERVQSELAFYETGKETEYRRIQKKADEYMKLWNESSETNVILSEIYSFIPNPGEEISIRIDGDEVSVYGYDDLSALSDLELAMKGSETFITGSVKVETLSLEQKEILQQTGQYVLVATTKESTREDI